MCHSWCICVLRKYCKWHAVCRDKLILSHLSIACKNAFDHTGKHSCTHTHHTRTPTRALHMHMYTHTHTQTHVHTHAHTHTHSHSHTPTYINTHTHTHTDTHTHTHTPTQTRTCMHAQAQTQTHSCTHANTAVIEGSFYRNALPRWCKLCKPASKLRTFFPHLVSFYST